MPGWARAWTLRRVVENGYAVLCAAREGVLTVSDAYGRVLAERASSASVEPGFAVPGASPRRCCLTS